MKKNKRKGEPKPAWPKRGSRACNDIFPIQLFTCQGMHVA